MPDLAIIILTFNENIHLARALENVLPMAKEVFVIDSYSTDDTVEIAKRYGAQVLQHSFINQAKQFQWALENAPITAQWVMKLDADEIIEADLADEIVVRLPQLSDDTVGVSLKRKTIFRGRWIKHGGRYPLILLRIWRRGTARVEDRWMDEHIVVSGEKIVTFKGAFADHNLNNLTFFTDKHNKYATREAIDVISKRYNLPGRDRSVGRQKTSRQAIIKRYFKESIYNHMPFEIAAISYFIYRYIFRFGILDGREGLSYHFLQCCWYRFLVGAKVREFEEALRHFSTPEKKHEELARLAGLRLADQ